MATYPQAMVTGGLAQLITHLRTKQFPAKVEAKNLQAINIAPKNESYVLNTLRFIGVLDKDGSRIDAAHKVFVLADDQFQSQFAEMVKIAYQGVFDLHGDSAWSEGKDILVSFFRQTDKSTEITGKRQADTFIKLAEIAGKRASSSSNNQKAASPKAKNGAPKPKSNSKVATQATPSQPSGTPVPVNPTVPQSGTGLSLAIKIEMVLPTTDKKEVYDALFQSIKENFSSGN